MIEIKVDNSGKKTEISCRVQIEGRENAVQEFYAVIKALTDVDEDVFCDAIGLHLNDKLEGPGEGDDDDESES